MTLSSIRRPRESYWRPTLHFLLLVTLSCKTKGEILCPPNQGIPNCSCFVLDDQLHIQCSGSDFATLKKSLQVLNGPVKSFSVYDLDGRATVLPNGVTDNVTSPVFHLQISHSSLEDLAENSLRGLAKSLESLAVVSSRLKFIPQTTLATLRRLKILDFEGNQLQELGAYSFHNILLQKLNLKGNLLENISEHAFWALEETLMEIDMSENKLKSFPYLPLRRLRLLSSLNLAWNELSDLQTLLPANPLPVTSERKKTGHTGAFDALRNGLKSGGLSPGNEITYGLEKPKESPMDWPNLKYLNLNSNYLRSLERRTFLPMRNLRNLLIHLNSIESVDPEVFFPLQELESLDLSHNKLTILPPTTFAKNSHLISIDLSNNHLHTVGEGLLQNLGQLRELFLNGNNILRLLAPTFLNSPNVAILYLQGNSLRHVESGAFAPLKKLTEIRLSDNFLRILPQDTFFSNEALTSISLDGNHLSKIAPGTFHHCKGLREIRLQNNQITSIPPGVLESLSLLEEVHLENNKLTMIRGMDVLKRIRHVTLSRNSFERLTGEMLPGTELSSLSLGHNSIRAIQDAAFANQTTLSILFLGNNKLTRLGPRPFLGLRSLERLYLQKNNISSIHSDCFSSQTKALQYLDLSYNQLKSINRAIFAGLAFIEEINLSNNLISLLEEGAFSYLKSLRIIDLSSNKLTVLDYTQVFHPGGLEILKMCCNSLKEFNVRVISATPPSSSNGASISAAAQQQQQQQRKLALKELDLQQNFLTGSTFRQIEMGRVEVLQISGNNLTDLDEATLAGFPSLSFFSAEKSHISSLPGTLFRSNAALSVIRLSDNFISHIPESSFLPEIPGKSSPPPPLRELHLRNNRLRAFPYKALSNTSLLEVLTLAGNRINTLDLNRISLPRLKQLDMNDNRLNKISGSSLTRSMPLLQVVDFGENNISRVANEFVRNLSLSQINFGGNSMEKVPYAFSDKWVGGLGSGGVSFVLNMSGNPLMNFYTEDHHNTNFSVMDLYLCDTNVSYLTSEEFKIYPRLHRLVIKRNPLTILPPAAFSNLGNLNLLDLSENAIEDVKFDSFTGLLQLKSLNLSNNHIKDIQPFDKTLAGLQDLDLSDNQLSRLAPETFANLISLVTLRIRGNLLIGLPAELFGPLARLAVLDLSKNAIESIPSTVLKHLETRISTLRLEENPLNCDCESKQLWDWLQLHPKVFSSSALPTSQFTASASATGISGTGLVVPAGQPNFICERPEEFRGRPILEADLDSFCSSPAIVKVDIQEVQPSSAIVSWQGRNNSGINGYMIGYHALNHDNRIQWTNTIPASCSEYRIPDLESDTPYLVCVLSLSTHTNSNITTSALTLLPAETVLHDSPISRCLKVNTSSVSLKDKFSFLHRRLGVIVGASLGILVFFLLMILLTCVKFKKRRLQRQQENGKADNNRVQEALTTTNTVGTLGGYHCGDYCNNHSNYLGDHNHHTPSTYSTLTRLGNGNKGIGGGHMSPEFLTYRHYSIATDTTTEMERL